MRVAVVDPDSVALVRGAIGWLIILPGLTSYDVVTRNRTTGGLTTIRSEATFAAAMAFASGVIERSGGNASGLSESTPALKLESSARATFGTRAR